jgi:hypothetical protein
MKYLKLFESYLKRTEWDYNGRTFKVGDIIDGSMLDELSGGNVGNQDGKFKLVQQNLSAFPDDVYNRETIFKDEPDYVEEETYRFDSMKDNFSHTPPIPEEGDGFHRIVVAKELGYDEILMWKKI